MKVVQIQPRGYADAPSDIEPVFAIRKGLGFIITGRVPENMTLEEVLALLASMKPSKDLEIEQLGKT